VRPTCNWVVHRAEPERGGGRSPACGTAHPEPARGAAAPAHDGAKARPRTSTAEGPRELLEILLAKRRHQARPPYGDWVARFTTLSEADRTAIRAAIAAMVRRLGSRC